MKTKSSFSWLQLGVVLLGLHGIWFVIAFFWGNSMFPSPVLVYQQLGTASQGDLFPHLLYSLSRILTGLLIALIFGAGLGFIMGISSRWNQMLGPILYLSYPIPKMALLPIILLLFGLGETSKVILIVLIIAPQLTLSVRDAVLNIPDKYYFIYRGIQASKWEQFKNITFPSALPALFSSLKVSLGMAISIVFFAENYGTQFGMGYFILDSWMRLDYPMMYLGIIILSFIGFIFFNLIDYLSRKVIVWQ